MVSNQTTIEFLEKASAMEQKGQKGDLSIPKKRQNISPIPPGCYNLGFAENIVAVFGTTPALWFLPVSTTPGDGKTFPTKLQSEK